jgi:hypothetical protein
MNKVRILPRLVPDGIRRDNKGVAVAYRFSLALMPDLRRAKLTGNAEDVSIGIEVDLDNWPNELAALLADQDKNFKLYLACDPVAPAAQIKPLTWYTRDRTTAGPYDGPQSREFSQQRAKSANTLWRRFFLADCHEYEQFGALAKTLDEAQNPPKPVLAALNDLGTKAPNVISYPVATLARAVEGTHAAHFIASLGVGRFVGLNKNSALPEPWIPTQPIARPAFFRSMNADLVGVFLPDTQANRLGIESGQLPRDDGAGTFYQLVDLVSQVLERGTNSDVGAATFVSRKFKDALRRHFKQQSDDNTKLTDYWTRFHRDFASAARPDPAILGDAPGLDRLDVFFAAMASYLAPWTRGRLPGIADDVTPDAFAPALAAVVADMHSAIAGYHAAWRPDSGPSVKAAADDCNPEDSARRKFINILARPSLAKFLGFVIDVEVKLDELHQALFSFNSKVFSNSYFYLMADFGAGSEVGSQGAIDRLPARLWTATLLARKSEKEPYFFGPCSKKTFGKALEKGLLSDSASALPTSPEDGGVWNLAEQGSDEQGHNVPRFALIDFDIDAALHAWENSSLDRATAHDKGGLGESIPSALPNLRTRGLALIDSKRRSALADEVMGRDSADSKKPQVFYSEELVVGYRLDVGVCANGKVDLPGKDRWRSLADRIVEYDDDDVPHEYHAWLGADGERESGLVKPITRNIKNSTGVKDVDQEQFAAQETIAVWSGGSLAIESEHNPKDPKQPHDPQGYAYQEMKPVCQLGTNLVFHLPSQGLPPLRFGRAYWMGARLAYVNGASVSLSEAAKGYYAVASTAAVGGDKPSEGHIFCRGERAGVPAILIPPDDLLAQPPSEQLRGETVGTAVVRSGGAVIKRYLVPARATFDVAEAHGQFDSEEFAYQRVPRGAFRSYARDPEGEFPHARPEPDKGKVKPNNPALVLKPGNSSTLPPYYPDPLTRACGLRVLQHGADASVPRTAEELKELRDNCDLSLSFYEDKNQTIDNARPILVEVRPFDAAPGQPLHKIRRDNQAGMTRLIVSLAPAADVDLLLWPVLQKDAQLLTMRAVRHAWTLLAKMVSKVRGDLIAFDTVGASPALVSALDLIGSATGELSLAVGPASTVLVEMINELCEPSRTVSDQRTLRAVRPVRKPLTAPRFNTLRPVRIVIDAKNLPKPGDAPSVSQRWRDYVADQERKSVPPLEFPSEPDGNATFFVGEIVAHRPSTGKVKFRATWSDYGDTVAKTQEDGATVFRHQTTPGHAEFSMEFERGKDPDESDVDLLRDDTGELRGLDIDFKDNKARLIKLALHAVSRFTEFYLPPNAKNSIEAAKTPEFETYNSKNDRALWIPATTRPAQPIVDRILPVFTWSRHEQLNNGVRAIVYRRNVALRIFLKRPWHSSGQGELLGVVCWPPNIFDGTDSSGEDAIAGDMAKCTLLDRLAPNIVDPKSEFLSRWGADPVHLSGALNELIPLREFRFAFKRIGHLQLPIHDDYPMGVPKLDIERDCPNEPPVENPPTPKNSVEVAIAAYYPVLEPQRGETWYCDVPLDPGKSYFPFVRLGLARYQEHALQDLELSYPVAEWAQIPPRREARVELLSEHEILVVVTGVGYHATNGDELPDGSEGKDDLNRTRFCIRVCRMVRPDHVPAHDEEINWLPVISQGQPLECRAAAEATDDDSIYLYRKFRLPQSWRRWAYAVIVEEFEPMVADGDIVGDSVVRDRGPMFACTIPLVVYGVAPSTRPEGGVFEDGTQLKAIPDV